MMPDEVQQQARGAAPNFAEYQAQENQRDGEMKHGAVEPEIAKETPRTNGKETEAVPIGEMTAEQRREWLHKGKLAEREIAKRGPDGKFVKPAESAVPPKEATNEPPKTEKPAETISDDSPWTKESHEKRFTELQSTTMKKLGAEKDGAGKSVVERIMLPKELTPQLTHYFLRVVADMKSPEAVLRALADGSSGLDLSDREYWGNEQGIRNLQNDLGSLDRKLSRNPPKAAKKVPSAPTPAADVSGKNVMPADALIAATHSGDFAAYREEGNRRDHQAKRGRR